LSRQQARCPSTTANKGSSVATVMSQKLTELPRLAAASNDVSRPVTVDAPAAVNPVLQVVPVVPGLSDCYPQVPQSGGCTVGRIWLAGYDVRSHPLGMFVVSEADATAIRAAFDRGGEFSAAIELRRRFPGIADNEQARACARTIAGWQPLPDPSHRVERLRRRRPR
jgi:hypothetical protein